MGSDEIVFSLINLAYHLLMMQKAQIDGSSLYEDERQKALLLLDFVSDDPVIQEIGEPAGIKFIKSMISEVGYIEMSPQSYTHSMLVLLINMMHEKQEADSRNGKFLSGRHKLILSAAKELAEECPDSPLLTKKVLASALEEIVSIASDISTMEKKWKRRWGKDGQEIYEYDG